MEKFIKTIMIYAFIMCILVSGINAAYIMMNKTNDDYTNKFKHIPSGIEICNTGSSHGLYGYNYEDYQNQYTCFNFGLVCQTLSYDYRLLNYYQGNLKEGSVIFITVSYLSLFGKQDTYDDDFNSRNKRYYKILPKEMIKEYDASTDFFVRRFPSLDAKTDLIKTFLGKSFDNSDQTWKRTTDEAEVFEDAEDAAIRHIIKNRIDTDGNRIYNQEEINALYNIINLCKTNQWKPILVTTPYLEEYTNAVNKVSPEFFGDFYSLMNQIIDDTGVEYYDYSTDKRFAHEYSYFLNSDHLNKDGARVFVDLLMDEAVKKKQNTYSP